MSEASTGWPVDFFRRRALHRGRDPGLRRLPLRKQRTDDRRRDDPYDLFWVGVVRAELRALIRVQTALEQRSEHRRINLQPVERRRLELPLDPLPIDRQRGVFPV